MLGSNFVPTDMSLTASVSADRGILFTKYLPRHADGERRGVGPNLKGA